MNGSQEAVENAAGTERASQVEQETRRWWEDVVRVDTEVQVRLLRLARETLGAGWQERTVGDFDRNYLRVDGDFDLLSPWALFHRTEGGDRLRELLASRGIAAAENSRERALLDAQEASWVSYWQLREVGEHGFGRARFVDRLTGEERIVVQPGIERSKQSGGIYAARIVDFEGRSILAGLFPRGAPPGDPRIEALISIARETFASGSDVDPARLRTGPDALSVINTFRMMLGLLRTHPGPRRRRSERREASQTH
jgi:hypothetical protein